MKFLIFQHISCEHPGIFRTFFEEGGISWHAVQLDAGDAIPDHVKNKKPIDKSFSLNNGISTFEFSDNLKSHFV